MFPILTHTTVRLGLLFLVSETIFNQRFTPAVNGGILSLIKDGRPPRALSLSTFLERQSGSTIPDRAPCNGYILGCNALPLQPGPRPRLLIFRLWASGVTV